MHSMCPELTYQQHPYYNWNNHVDKTNSCLEHYIKYLKLNCENKK